MPAVDLTRARATYLEKVLLDRVTISRDPARKRDSEFREETGDYEGGDDLDTIATDVPAKAKELNPLRESTEDVGAAPMTKITYEVALAYDDAVDLDIRAGDKLTFTTAQDPLLAGVSMFVVEIVTGTLLIGRKVFATRRVDAVDQR